MAKWWIWNPISGDGGLMGSLSGMKGGGGGEEGSSSFMRVEVPG